MSATDPSPSRGGWLAAAAIVTLFSLLGFTSSENLATSGLSAQADGTVTKITDDGPAERAGIREGDRILAISGIAYDQTIARFKEPRPAVGDTRRFAVARGDERFEATVVYGRIKSSTLATFIAAIAIGLTFLVTGLGSYFRRPNDVTRLSALLGISAMIAFGLPVYVPILELRLVMVLILGLVGMALLPLLLELTLRFPAVSASRPWLRLALYAPIVTLVGLFGVALFAAPGLSSLIQALGSIVPAVFALTALITALVRWRRARTDADRRACGWLVAGFVLGLVPVLVGSFASSLPGAGYYFLSLAALPLGIARGLRQEAPRPVERLEAQPNIVSA